MRIGIDCHNLEGQRTGVGRYLWNLLREWNGLTPQSGSATAELQLFLYFKNEIPIHFEKWNCRILGGKSNAIFKHWLLPREARRDRVDVLFCPDYVLPLYVGPRKSHIKTAVTIHDIIYEARPEEYSWPSWADRILLKWASRQSAKKADVIFAPSEFTKSEVLKYYLPTGDLPKGDNVNSDKVVVTPLAPDPIFRKLNPLGLDPDGLAKVKQKYGIGNKYVFFVGSIFNRRFLPQTIRAFSEFGKEYSDFKFLIIGKNHTKPFQDIGALVAEANRELGREAIIWKEQASDADLVYLYNCAFVTLWLSSYEGFGLPVLESMACGTPVITSMKDSLPEVAGDAAMYIAHPENSEEISNALTHLVRYDSYYNELVAKGLARAAQFSWQKTARQTIDKVLDME